MQAFLALFLRDHHRSLTNGLKEVALCAKLQIEAGCIPYLNSPPILKNKAG